MKHLDVSKWSVVSISMLAACTSSTTPPDDGTETQVETDTGATRTGMETETGDPTCASNFDCPYMYYCGVDNVCVLIECDDDADCDPDEFCSEYECIPNSALLSSPLEIRVQGSPESGLRLQFTARH